MIKKNSPGIKTDRRVQLRAAAANVRMSMSPKFRKMSADDIMKFLRADEPVKRSKQRCGR